MENSIPFLFAALVGFGHAFEADHLVAVSNIVTKRNKLILAIKDGIYWGLGHSSTILFIGLLIIIGKINFPSNYFLYFEAFVGLMLILLGAYRLYYYFMNKQHYLVSMESKENHHLAYGVGLIHGLAGSGAMVLLVMSEIKDNLNSMLYLLIFGAGSVVGMLVAAGIFSLPFSKKLSNNAGMQMSLVVLSSLLCIGLGSWILFENVN